MSELNITAIVETFASQITAAVEASVTQRLQAAIASAFGAPAKRGPGRPPKSVATTATAKAAHASAATGSSAKPARAAKPATPKAARARKLQGQYMGALKSLTGAVREKVKQTAKDKGVAEAVKLALSLKKSKA